MDDSAVPGSDYVIVGAGSSGAVIAARLTENPDTHVTLLEAGGPDKDKFIHIPAAFAQLFGSDVDWNYFTADQPELKQRQIFWPRGKTLGGSSSLNAMMWVRGFAADYDAWAAAAGDQWSYDEAVKWYRRIENTPWSTDPDHGRGGPMQISRQRSPSPLNDLCMAAAARLGYPQAPPNVATPDGFTETVVTQRRGARESTADAYLREAMKRPNLTVLTGAHATRVVFEGTRAVGVEFIEDRTTRVVTAKREVILSGGAVNSPALLMHSGIGDAEHLRHHGIDVLVDRPDVGSKMLDHLAAGITRTTDEPTLYRATKPKSLINYLARRKGMLTSNVAETYGFLQTGLDDSGLADIEILFVPAPFLGQGLVAPEEDGITIAAVLLQPRSVGTVRLASADPLAAPIIDPRYLTDPDGHDRATLAAGVEICAKLFETAPLSNVVGNRYLRPALDGNPTLGELVDAAINLDTQTLYHPVGTCRMGTDGDSVVDPDLRVRGVQGLRVADASVMPVIIRGHTNAPAIMIGEKAADLLAQA
ncbi:GMC family oxidoreductase [Williamsia sp. M5A3_1d]